MREVLCRLGMRCLRAGFSGTSSKQGLFLSKVVCKSFADVHEEGTEAAAAAAAIVISKHTQVTLLLWPLPFLLLIQHVRANGGLPCGRSSSPQAEEEDAVSATYPLAMMFL